MSSRAPQHWVTGWCSTCLSQYTGAGDLNSGHALVNKRLTETSFQPGEDKIFISLSCVALDFTFYLFIFSTRRLELAVLNCEALSFSKQKSMVPTDFYDWGFMSHLSQCVSLLFIILFRRIPGPSHKPYPCAHLT